MTLLAFSTQMAEGKQICLLASVYDETVACV